MRGSTSKLVLAAGCIAVLALAIGLVQATRSATLAQPRPERAAPIATPAAPPVADPWATTSAPPIAASEPHPATPPPRGHVTTSVPRPSLPAAMPLGMHRELKRDANGHLVPIVPFADLRSQIGRTDAAMNGCIERSGQRPSGKATLTFTVAAQGGKLVVEATGAEDEGTLAGYPELLECMHRTANALVLEGRPVPELGTPIYVRRHVRLDNGALAENSLFNFSYNP